MGVHFRDWLEECGFGEQTPGLCYIMEDEEGDVLGAATRPGLSLFGSEAVENVSHVLGYFSIFEFFNFFQFRKRCYMPVILSPHTDCLLFAAFKWFQKWRWNEKYMVSFS